MANNELGLTINISSLSAKTYNGTAVYYSTTNMGYFANTATGALLDLETDGYVNAANVNSGLANVSTDQNAQTVITFGAASADTSPVTAGSTPTIKGLMYGQKVTITDELGNNLTPTTVTTPTTSCYISTNVAIVRFRWQATMPR